MTTITEQVRMRGRDRLHEALANELEGRILSGELAVGERLPAEGEIARSHGISTRSVREAVQILETKGLVRRRHGERTVVVRDDVAKFLDTLASTVRQLISSDPDHLIKLMVARRMIETEVVGILTSPGNAMSAAVKRALDDMRDARDAGDFAGFTEADAAFHRALVHSTGNQVISLFYDNLYALISDLIRVTSRVPSKSLDAAYDEHAAIYDNIRRRADQKAKMLMRKQIDNSAAYLKVAIMQAQADGVAR
jgi:GntR family transcriptional regulator, transcriptional repressor for pyruvate dehydrogenase complex